MSYPAPKFILGVLMVTMSNTGTWIHSAEAAASSAVGLPKVQLKVEKYQLPNGLTVLLHQDHAIPMVSYHTWYKVGSRDESKGVTGAAHMLEHMMFKGAQKYSGKDFDHILHRNGITNNAFTSWDYTGFYQNLPSDKLELMMDLEVDRMRFLKIDPQDLKSELQVVAEERRWRIDNNPQGLMRETLFSKMFQGSPYSWPVIGFMEDIQAYSSDKLRFFYDTYYVPNNAVLVLAGDFDLTQAKRWIEKYYGALPKKEIPPRTYSRPTELRGSEKIILKKKVQSQQMMLAYSSVDAHHPDAPALEVAAYILGGGLSSRLYKKLVYEIQSVSSVSAFQLSNDASGLFAFSAALRPQVRLDQVQKQIHKEVEELVAKGVTEAELTKAKNQIMKEFVDGLMTLDGRARTLAANEILFGDYRRMFDDLNRYQTVSAEDVRRVLKQFVKLDKELMVALVPEG